jgi:molybdopterin-guanine dinucleotide biosynthesis protein MobB
MVTGITMRWRYCHPDMRVAAVFGPSGSGKTTLIVALIRHFVTEGRTVGAVKHTHHNVAAQRRAPSTDTERFADAGADPVVFAGDGEAIVFSAGSARRITYAEPRELLEQFTTDIVLIEGFRKVDVWPRIELDRILSLPEALAILDRISP